MGYYKIFRMKRGKVGKMFVPEDSDLLVYIKNGTDTISTRMSLTCIQSNNLRKSPLIYEMLDNVDRGEALEFIENDVTTAVNFLTFAANQSSESISVIWNKDWFILSHKWLFEDIARAILLEGKKLVDRYKMLF